MLPPGLTCCACRQAVQSNWANEFAKWAPSLKAVLYDGTPEERRALRAEHVEPGGFNTLITHYDLALRDRNALRKVRPCTGTLLVLPIQLTYRAG